MHSRVERQQKCNCHVLIEVRKISGFMYSISEEYLFYLKSNIWYQFWIYSLFVASCNFIQASGARPERRSFENKNCQFTNQITCHEFTVSATGHCSTFHEKSCMLNSGFIRISFLVIVNTVIADLQRLASNELWVFANITLLTDASTRA